MSSKKLETIEIDGLSFEPFILSNEIQQRISVLGEEISQNYKSKKPVFIGILNGSFMFMSDLMKSITVPCEVSFIKLASYMGKQQDQIHELIGLGINLEERHVVIVEDVVDSGESLKHTIASLKEHNVASLNVCTLLLKPSCLKFEFDNITHVGFEIQKEFVVGYGLDYNGLFRNLPDIYQEVSLK